MSAGRQSASDFILLPNQYKTPHNLIVDVFKDIYDSLDFDNSFFMTNASIVDPNYKPLGLVIYDYQTLQSLNMGDGSGNFLFKTKWIITF